VYYQTSRILALSISWTFYELMRVFTMRKNLPLIPMSLRHIQSGTKRHSSLIWSFMLPEDWN